jgi:hypothetical protein
MSLNLICDGSMVTFFKNDLALFLRLVLMCARFSCLQ